MSSRQHDQLSDRLAKLISLATLKILAKNQCSLCSVLVSTEKNEWLFNCYMFHLLHQLVAYFIHLLVGVRKVVEKIFLELFLAPLNNQQVF